MTVAALLMGLFLALLLAISLMHFITRRPHQ